MSGYGRRCDYCQKELQGTDGVDRDGIAYCNAHDPGEPVFDVNIDLSRFAHGRFRRFSIHMCPEGASLWTPDGEGNMKRITKLWSISTVSLREKMVQRIEGAMQDEMQLHGFKLTGSEREALSLLLAGMQLLTSSKEA